MPGFPLDFFVIAARVEGTARDDGGVQRHEGGGVSTLRGRRLLHKQAGTIAARDTTKKTSTWAGLKFLFLLCEAGCVLQ